MTVTAAKRARDGRKGKGDGRPDFADTIVRSYARGDLERAGSLLMSYPAALETYRWLREAGRLPAVPAAER